MAWIWHEIDTYRASIGGGRYYGGLQLFAKGGFYINFRFHKSGPLPAASTTHRNRFYGHMDWQQMAGMVDLLRNEKPVRFGFLDSRPDNFHLMTGSEPVGEGDGELSPDS